jgi:hypothetical protein
MQKVEGSSPFIRLYILQNGIFGCLFRQQMTFCTRRGDELSPFGGLEPSTPSLPSWGGEGSAGTPGSPRPTKRRKPSESDAEA